MDRVPGDGMVSPSWDHVPELGSCPWSWDRVPKLGSCPQAVPVSPGMKARPGGGTGQEVTPAPARSTRGGDRWWRRAVPPEAVGQQTPPRAGRGGLRAAPQNVQGSTSAPAASTFSFPVALVRLVEWSSWVLGGAGAGLCPHPPTWEQPLLAPILHPPWGTPCGLGVPPGHGWPDTELILRAVPALGGLRWGVVLQLPQTTPICLELLRAPGAPCLPLLPPAWGTADPPCPCSGAAEKAPPGAGFQAQRWKPSLAVGSLGTAGSQHAGFQALRVPSTGVSPGDAGLPKDGASRGCSLPWGRPCTLQDAVPGKQKGLAAPSTRDGAMQE